MLTHEHATYTEGCQRCEDQRHEAAIAKAPNPTLLDVLDRQKYLSMTTMHLVYIGPERFHLAHTDRERSAGTNTECGCKVHQWLETQPGPPAAPGWYVVMSTGSHRPDGPPAYVLEPLNPLAAAESGTEQAAA